MGGRRVITGWLVAMTTVFMAQARVGETLKQSEERYGGTGQELQDVEAFILKNARNVVYLHGDWIITVAYVNDVTMRIQYEKVPLQQQPQARLSKEDVAEILKAEDAGGWSALNEQSQKTGKAYVAERYPPPSLRSASGLMARYRVFQMTVESAAAARYEAGLNPQLLRTPSRKRVAL